MTTHELAKKLLEGPNVKLYMLPFPTDDHWDEFAHTNDRHNAASEIGVLAYANSVPNGEEYDVFDSAKLINSEAILMPY